MKRGRKNIAEMTKSGYKYFIYISVLCLIFVLYKADFLQIPKFHNLTYLFLSLVLLLLGYIVEVVVWKNILISSGFSVTFKNCFIANGLSIFSKYIPGKVWILVGRAAYIAKSENQSLSKLSYISFKMQIIASWTGLILGVIGLFFFEGALIWGWLILFLWIFLSVIMFSRRAHNVMQYILNKILKKNLVLPIVSAKNIIKLSPWFFLNWLLWSLGFYFLSVCLFESNIHWGIGLGFPLATTLGVLSFFAPGGLGAREGVLIGFLSFAGLSITEATTIAVVSRLWFLSGEAIFFISSLILNSKKTPSRII
jgi:glycosyltransferase 2 family protein